MLPTPLASDAGPRGGTTGFGLRDWSRGLLPTPKASDGKRNASPGELRRNDPALGAVAALLPTPNAADGMGGPGHQGRAGGYNLRTAASLLPTPTAMDSKASGGSSPSDVTLTDAVVRTELGTRPNARLFEDRPPLLNTPTAADAKRTHVSTRARESFGATTLPEQVETLLPTPNLPSAVHTIGGGPTPPPSDDGRLF
jgi:hypothetical protein